MSVNLLSPAQWARACAADGEFRQAAKYWTGGLKLCVGDVRLEIALDNGHVTAGTSPATEGIITFSGDENVWSAILAQPPTRFNNDLMANIATDNGIVRSAESVVAAQYYAAAMRAVELLRPAPAAYPLRPGDVGQAGRFDSPVGRYIHLNLEGYDHRIYFEEAGQGIPVLLQHTAGCHSSQWRHLFEIPEITQRFRLIAYDLPYHGKSIPPVERPWWSQAYNLKGDFLRCVPLTLTHALNLESPIFMGCSVGGLLALDLAHKHPEIFRAVISVEGALHIEGSQSQSKALYHPQVNSEYKARLMNGLMSPTSPEAYRKETGFVYASGWPPVFLGDLHYYLEEYDLRQHASDIDTTQVGVHILSGEYDYSGRSELGREAHSAISGSTWSEMSGVGHFPMSENPVAFIEYLMPILNTYRT